jgi:hypothetical protein
MNKYNEITKNINNLNESEQIKIIKNNVHLVSFINNPSEKVQLKVIKNNGYNICYINNPSENVQIKAVKLFDYNEIEIETNEYFIYYIKSEKALDLYNKLKTTKKYYKMKDEENIAIEKRQLKLVKEWAWNIEYISNPSEKVQLAAVNQKEDGYVIKYIKNPSEKVQLIAVKNLYYDGIF